MRIFYLAITVLFLTTGCQKDNDTKAPSAANTIFSINSSANIDNPNSLIGLWESNRIQSTGSSDVEFIIRMQFEEKTLTIANKCVEKSSGDTIVAQISVPYKLENNKVLVLENKTESVTQNGGECRVSSKINDPLTAQELNIVNGIMRDSISGSVFIKIGN